MNNGLLTLIGKDAQMKTCIKTSLIIASILFILSTIAGCDQAYQDITDANSPLNQAADRVSQVAPVVGAGAKATGTPWGAGVFLGTTILSALLGVYSTYRKNIVIDQRDSEYQNIETTTKAIVAAIEKVSEVPLGEGTVGDTVKAEVKKQLQDNQAYKVGKAIISGLKS